MTTIIDVMGDAEAFGPWFEGPSWNAWRATKGRLRAAYDASGACHFRRAGPSCWEKAHKPGTPCRSLGKPSAEMRDRGCRYTDRTPRSSASNPAIMRRVVVLPQPLGPRKVTSSPRSTVRSKSLTTNSASPTDLFLATNAFATRHDRDRRRRRHHRVRTAMLDHVTLRTHDLEGMRKSVEA